MSKRLRLWCLGALIGSSAGFVQAAPDWTAGFSACSGYANETSTVTCSDTTGVSAIQVTAVGTDSYATGVDFALRDVNYYSGGGLGVDPLGQSQGSPEHSIDNKGWIDAVVVHFDESVILNEVTLGWRAYDWDFSVFAYTGGGNPASSTFFNTTTGTSTLDLNTTLGGSWQLVSTYAAHGAGCSSDSGCGDNLTVTGLNAANVSSTWWVISAYANAYGTGNAVGPGTLSAPTDLSSSGKDYFKLLSVAGAKYSPPPPPPPGVPEPASLALVSVALLGAWGGRRRFGTKR